MHMTLDIHVNKIQLTLNERWRVRVLFTFLMEADVLPVGFYMLMI